ncbi:DUF5694 domain-containing protein [Microbulbifer sp. OS29]|uniref:DUF5694 domain-containing protein n=1 Tax=Microbulbifer okhotskensis TaxID=2926617 RepID=A0A9X2EW36_9GAMM|nr:DUF5694 domain-containing protein [Microbulbifer okhotskensis]MCO1336996.1 DUF5694 domain-containing protein [Microbulbifer okhotskensis]
MENITRRLTKFFMLTLNIVSLSAYAESVSDTKPAQVMFFGSFHFSNPGNDIVKMKTIDIHTEENQRYLEDLSSQIAVDAPTHVLLECSKESENKINQNYKKYTKGEYTLKTGETEQLGFRIAQKAGLSKVVCYDADQDLPYGELLAYLEKHSPERKKLLDENFEAWGKRFSDMHASLSLGQVLDKHNDPIEDKINVGSYILLNDIGQGDNFIGADLSSKWWSRNFRMYANIQAVAQPGTKVFVLGGQGHSSMMRPMLELDNKRETWDVRRYF